MFDTIRRRFEQFGSIDWDHLFGCNLLIYKSLFYVVPRRGQKISPFYLYKSEDYVIPISPVTLIDPRKLFR